MYSVAVLAGGDSHERAVSLDTGQCVAEALSASGHQVALIDPAGVDLATIAWSRFDACFIALHGGPGENGRIQQRLRLLKVPFTGSSPAASRLGMSKSASKERFLQAGVPTAPYVLFHADDSMQRVAAAVAPLGWPLAIKPDSQGSSLGVGRAANMDELHARIYGAAAYDDYLVAEPWIDGREFTVSVLEREPLPVIEIVHDGGFFDYAAKYGARAVQRRFELDLDQATERRIVDAAIGAAKAIGASSLSRVDLLMDRQANLYVLEVNTVPGMTRGSLAPLAAARAGLSMPQLCEQMVRNCLAAGALS
jgi:D-alanine-D-alanine ligase